MAKGQKVSDLYLSLGIDLSELEADYVRADQSVSANMKRLQNEIKNTKLQLQVDASNINLSAADKVLATQQAINRQIDLQTEKVKLATAAWRQEVEATDAQSAAAQRLQSNMLREQLNLNKLQQQRVDSKTGVAKQSEKSIENRLREKIGGMQENAGLIDAMFGTQITTPLGLLLSKISVVDKAMESLKEAGGGLSTISKSLAGVALRAAVVATAITAASVALVKMSHSSIEAGERIYKLAQRLHVSYATAAQMSKAFAMVGMDANDAGAALMRLDKQVLNAGTSGNAASRMLSAFGVSLRNGDGTLKDYNQQLRALADGYQRAKKAGMEEEYVTQTLGARSREMIDILEDYDKAMAMAGEVKGASLLNPEKAHELSMEYRQMGMQAKQFGNGLSQALTPIAEWVLPRITELFKHGVEFLNQHREGILALSHILGALLAAAIKGLDLILTGAGQLVNLLTVAANLGIHLAAAIQGISFEEANRQVEKMLGLLGASADATNKIDTNAQAAAQSIIDATDKLNGKTDSKDSENQWRQQEQEYAKWVESHNRGVQMIEEAQQINFHNTMGRLHSVAAEYAMASYDVNLWLQQQWRASQSADERAGIEELAAARIAKAYEEMVDKINRLNESLQDKIYHLLHSEAENKIYDLNREIEQLQRDGADPNLISQYKAASLNKINEETDSRRKQQNSNESTDSMFGKTRRISPDDRYHALNYDPYGGRSINMPVSYSTGKVAAISDGVYRPQIQASGAGRQQPQQAAQPAIVTVSINNPVVENDAMLVKLGNAVADKMLPLVRNALDNNRYSYSV